MGTLLILPLLAALGCSSIETDLGESTSAATVCLDLPAAADATIARSQPSKRFGDKKVLEVGDGDEALVRFDLAPLPANAVVSTAALLLYVSKAAPSTSLAFHRVTGPWQEASVSFASFAQHFAPESIGHLNIASDNVLRAVDVKAALGDWRNGTYPNLGFLLSSDAASAVTIVSREGGTAPQRPTLRVCYSQATDHCAAQPCANHGSCTNTQSGFSCECAAGARAGYPQVRDHERWRSNPGPGGAWDRRGWVLDLRTPTPRQLTLATPRRLTKLDAVSADGNKLSIDEEYKAIAEWRVPDVSVAGWPRCHRDVCAMLTMTDKLRAWTLRPGVPAKLVGETLGWTSAAAHDSSSNWSLDVSLDGKRVVMLRHEDGIPATPRVNRRRE